jgi:uncharacterized membrane protein
LICGTLRRFVSTCSISPVGLLRVFIGLAATVLAIGVGFALMGAWLVLPFSGLEVLMLGAAFLHHARRIGAEKELELRSIRQN